MRIDRSIPFLALLAIAAACGTPASSATAQPDAAAAPVVAPPVPVAEAMPTIAMNMRWDSGPLDLSYRHERSSLDAMHAGERAHPDARETADHRGLRQARESKALEARYMRGRKNHDSRMPPR